MFRDVKSQIASMDLVISGIAIILFASLIIGFVMMTTDDKEPNYQNPIFANIKYSKYNFFEGHVIDEESLSDFANRSYANKIKPQLFAGSSQYSTEKSDICMFFLNGSIKNMDVIKINGSDTLGKTYDSPSHSGKDTCSLSNTCKFYKSSDVYKKMVVRNDTIVMLYINVCSV